MDNQVIVLIVSIIPVFIGFLLHRFNKSIDRKREKKEQEETCFLNSSDHGEYERLKQTRNLGKMKMCVKYDQSERCGIKVKRISTSVFGKKIPLPNAHPLYIEKDIRVLIDLGRFIKKCPFPENESFSLILKEGKDVIFRMEFRPNIFSYTFDKGLLKIRTNPESKINFGTDVPVIELTKFD